MTPFERALYSSTPTQFLQDVVAGLTSPGQKSLPPKYLYDDVGSALFEAITQLPEYGLWRAERRLLTANAHDIATRAQAAYVVELGSGSANKTWHLLNALLRHGPLGYAAVDVSSTALAMTRRELANRRGLIVRGIEAEYERGLAIALRERRQGAVLVLFLGSSLGNMDALESLQFLRHIRRLLAPGDSVLLGADLEKPRERMLAAYDDPIGVTAAFNLNMLARINRELGADFDLTRFRHRARFNERTRSVEMHLESLCDQAVRFAKALPVVFQAGETIHTESSHKYSLAELERLMSASGFRREAQWIDPEWAFASSLFIAI